AGPTSTAPSRFADGSIERSCRLLTRRSSEFRVLLLRLAWNDLHFDRLLVGFRKMDRPSLLFEPPHEVRIEVGKLLESFPRENLVITRWNGTDAEVAILVCERGLKEVNAVAVLIRNEHGLNARYWRPLVNDDTFDISRSWAEQHVHGARHGAGK